MFKRNVLFILCSFSLLLGLVFIMNGNLTFATDNNTYYARDLQVGDILPVGATIVSDVKYHYSSGDVYEGFYISYVPSVKVTVIYDSSSSYFDIENIKISVCSVKTSSSSYYLRYYSPTATSDNSCKTLYDTENAYFYSTSLKEALKNDLKNYDGTYFVDYNKNFTIDNYKDVFSGSDFNFDFWVVKKIAADVIYLSPIENNNVILNKPSVDNDYNFDFSCGDSSNPEFNWYKYSVIDEYTISNLDSSLDAYEWDIANNVYSLYYSFHYKDLSTSVLRFKFTANKNDIVRFEMKNSNNDLGVFINDDEVLYYADNYFASDYYSYFYKLYSFSIATDGEQNLDFFVDTWNIYNNFDISIRNPILLSPINTGAKLDQSLVSEGDVLYYEAVCENGSTLGEKIEYIKPVVEDKEETDNVVDDENVENDKVDNDKVESQDKVENPNTFAGNMFILFVIVLLLSLGSLVIFDYKRKSLK